jgi:hypothetical protein
LSENHPGGDGAIPDFQSSPLDFQAGRLGGDTDFPFFTDSQPILTALLLFRFSAAREARHYRESIFSFFPVSPPRGS